MKFNTVELEKVTLEVERLRVIGAIKEVDNYFCGFVSPIFVILKPDGKVRLILNLKKLNTYVEKLHFKIEDWRAVCNSLRSNDYMCKVDLKDAYLSIPVSEYTSRFFCFKFGEKYYAYQALPFGFSQSPYIFTKVLKIALTQLRTMGIKIIAYLDDLLIIHSNPHSCREAADVTISLLSNLGFTINMVKSVLTPTRVIEYLGLIFDTCKMSISLPERKVTKIKQLCNRYLTQQRWHIQEVSELQGTLISACPAVQYGLLYTRELARLISLNLVLCNNNYNDFMSLSTTAKEDLMWWQNNVGITCQPIRPDTYDKTIYTDACPRGYGGHCEEDEFNGHWSFEEQKLHINILELMTVEKALKIFCPNDKNIRIHLRIDNITAVAYINKLGGTQSLALQKIAKNIWTWAIARNIWLSATYIKSKHNFKADELSRRISTDSHWRLSTSVFNEIVSKFGCPSIDLFASSLNHKVPRYVSYQPEAGAEATDAFTVSWRHEFAYIFPPFSLIPRVIRKIESDNAIAIVVVPDWPSQTWYPDFVRLTKSESITFGPSKSLVKSPVNNLPHDLHRSLRLRVALLSAHHSHS